MENYLFLSSMCGGAIQEKFNRAVSRVSENILNDNTDQTKTRTITIRIAFKPDKNDPETVTVNASVKTALIPETDSTTQLYLDESEEGITAREFGMNPKTGEIL